MTSYPNSRLLADCPRALLAAVSEVAENSLFAFADASDAPTFDAAAAASCAPDDWLHAHIRYAGPADGQFTMTLPAPLARRLCAAFAGADAGEEIAPSDLVDFTGELANMVCGTWLTRECQQESFALMPPLVMVGGPGCATVDSSGVASSANVYLAIDDTPIRLEIGWSARQPAPPGPRPEAADAR